MQLTSMKGSRKGFSLTGLCVLAISFWVGIGAASAQQLAARGEPERGQSATAPETAGRQAYKPREQYPYYVDFRARTAASYGHAFVWYGRRTDRRVEVAGLHPAGESTVPYVLGHVLPVPSETGASLRRPRRSIPDEQLPRLSQRSGWQTRLRLHQEAAEKFAGMECRDIQLHGVHWRHCEVYGFEDAIYHLLYPEEWVDNLRKINGDRKVVQLAPERVQ